jgi:quercetin dioxygenase-like cupin family protein
MRMIGFGLAALLGGLAAAQVPLEQEPRHHLEFANDALRVISPQIPPGDTTLEHIHTHDEATVCIQGSQTRGKPHDGEWGNPGRVCVPGTVGLVEYTGKPRSHTVQNLGSQTYHLLLVENLRDSGWKENQALTTPGLKIGRENRSFRIYDADLSGSGVPEHVHEVPTVVILVSGAAMTADKHLDQPGTWALIPAGTPHRVAAHGEAKVLEIEVR